MRFDILTLFPEVFEPYLSTTIVGRAREQKLIDVQLHNIRDYTSDKHHTVDDTPYGGGAGQVLKIEPIDKALKALKNTPPHLPSHEGRKENFSPSSEGESEGVKTIVLSARGQQFTQAKAAEYSKLDSLILICGRYEGIDQRVIDHLADEEISVGPYVLAGGELPALILLETVSRLIPGVLGNPDSLAEESFFSNKLMQLKANEAKVEYPHYTKPADYNGWRVPEILLSGDHAAIKRWRDEQRKSNA